MVAGNNTQGMPDIDTPLTFDDGQINVTWFRFLLTLYTRSGGQAGNNAAYFSYPNTLGTAGQFLTSQGPSTSSTWQTVTIPTKVSQLTNDALFLTPTALTPYSTTAQTSTLISTGIASVLSNATPLIDLGLGGPGVATTHSRSDHFHPSDTTRVALSALTGVAANPGNFVLPGTNVRIAFGTTVLTLGGAGGITATVPYGMTFASIFTFIVSNGDNNANTGNVNSVFTSMTTTSCLCVCPTATPNQLFRFNWLAIGK